MKSSKEEKGSDGDIYTNCPKGRVYDNWGVSTTLHQCKPFTLTTISDAVIKSISEQCISSWRY